MAGADLREANLTGACLAGANLAGADLDQAVARTRITPEAGAFIAWKKVENGAVLKLEILEDAQRVGGLVGRKCRASEVRVLEAFGGSGGEYRSCRNEEFEYRVGAVARVDNFDADPKTECAAGIHFFMSRAEAEAYFY